MPHMRQGQQSPKPAVVQESDSRTRVIGIRCGEYLFVACLNGKFPRSMSRAYANVWSQLIEQPYSSSIPVLFDDFAARVCPQHISTVPSSEQVSSVRQLWHSHGLMPRCRCVDWQHWYHPCYYSKMVFARLTVCLPGAGIWLAKSPHGVQVVPRGLKRGRADV